MALMTVAEVRQIIQTDYPDNALQMVINGIEEEVVDRFGALSSQTDDIVGGGKSIWVSRPISAITSITESVLDTDTVLASDDYIIRHDRQIDRINTGTNPRSTWGERVAVVYTNQGVIDRRKLVYVKLIELEVSYRGVMEEKTGDYSVTSLNYRDERNRILSILNEGIGFV